MQRRTQNRPGRETVFWIRPSWATARLSFKNQYCFSCFQKIQKKSSFFKCFLRWASSIKTGKLASLYKVEAFAKHQIVLEPHGSFSSLGIYSQIIIWGYFSILMHCTVKTGFEVAKFEKLFLRRFSTKMNQIWWMVIPVIFWSNVPYKNAYSTKMHKLNINCVV